MTCDESKRLFADYWSRSLPSEDELALEEHLDRCSECRAEVDRLGALWRDLPQIPTPEPSAAVRTRFYDMLRGATETSSRRAPAVVWQIAAGIALLACGAAIGYALRSGNTELAQLREEVSTMRQLVTLSLLQQQSASDRLRGVSWAYRVEPSDSEVLTALLDAVNRDPNVNVRLAAVDALHAFASSPLTRESVKSSLENQSAPLVQVAIIDLLVDLKEKEAGPELRRLMENASTNSGVRERAQWALERLE